MSDDLGLSADFASAASSGSYLDDLPPSQRSSILAAAQASAHAQNAQSPWNFPQGDAGAGDQGRWQPPSAADRLDEDIEEHDRQSNSSYSSWDTEAEEARLKMEWDENVRQLQTIVHILLIPYIGKYFGRKWSYWGEYRSARNRPVPLACRVLTIGLTVLDSFRSMESKGPHALFLRPRLALHEQFDHPIKFGHLRLILSAKRRPPASHNPRAFILL